MQGLQLVHEQGNFRKRPVDNDDIHFALRTSDFEATVAELESKGYRADLAEDDPKRTLVKRTGLAGFPQIFLTDPDLNVIEINHAPPS